ncbi:MAG: hypothetical protein GKR88_15675 [Flavobacteriaceae bacterium]|nr:MAG: hypothetical protein GKR88_15675 [Flavobacteriaceae bacterium]
MRILIFFLLVTFSLFSQGQKTSKVWRINFLNPSIEVELPISSTTALSLATGIGYSISYPHTNIGGDSGFITSFNPFLDVQQKWFYNFNKREAKKLNISNNSGNFISGRVLIRSESLFGNSNGTDTLDFALGPTWGIQRKYGKNFHFLFDMGPIYYFDIKGRSGFFPLMLQINLGFDL